MTGPLRNPRHEKFAQCLLEGKTAVDAHEQAGYARDDGNAARLAANPKIQERLVELQNEIAGEAKITVQGLLGELEDARKKATDLEQLSAAVRAIESKAKISGLLVQKVEVGGPGDFGKCNSIEAVVDEILKYEINPYHDLRDEDRDYLVALFERFFAEADAYVEAITARPYRNSHHAPKALPSPHRPHLNGNTRS
jgi:phage terminase small subunit